MALSTKFSRSSDFLVNPSETNHERRRTNMLSSVLTLAVFCIAAMMAETQDSPRDAIELYFRAHATGNGDFIRRAFTPDARIEFVENGELKQWTRDEFAARFQTPA